MQLSLDEREMNINDGYTMIRWIARKEVGRPIVWDYLRENWNSTKLR